MRKIQWSRCQGSKDFFHQRVYGTWDNLVTEATDIVPLDTAYEPKYAKSLIPAIIPAVWHPFISHRKMEGISHFDIIGLDVDNSHKTLVGYWPDRSEEIEEECCKDPVTPYELMVKAQQAGLATCGHSTFSHKEDWPKARVFVPLSRPITADELPAASEVLLTALGLQDRRGSVDIKVIRTANRIYFRAGYQHKVPYAWETKGEWLQVPDDLSQVPVPPLAALPQTAEAVLQLADLKKQRIEAGFTDGDDWYKAYPINFKTLRLGDLLDALMPHKIKRWTNISEGRKARCHCPWAYAHGTKTDDDCAVIYEHEDGWPTFWCARSHTKTLKDICEKAGIDLLNKYAESLNPRISEEDIASLESFIKNMRKPNG